MEKDKSIRNLIFLALFYAKSRKKLRVKHPILANLNIVLAKGKVKGYPTYKEIQDRAEVYNIKV